VDPTLAYAVAIVATFCLNLPMGYWRAGVRKFSPAWFVAVHAAVPCVVALRFALGIPFRWAVFPLFVAAYFGGQTVGARVRQRRAAGERPDQPSRP
jgi:hypothetical protein